MLYIKEIKPISFFYFRTKTTVNELAGFFPVGQQLLKEAVQLSVFVTGPVHWHYFGMTDINRPFTLEIAIPVGEIPKNYDGEFHFKRTESFKCISLVHEGAWTEMPQRYGQIMEYMNAHQLTPLGMHRELYINADFHHPEANTTEIQFGIE